MHRMAMFSILCCLSVMAAADERETASDTVKDESAAAGQPADGAVELKPVIVTGELIDRSTLETTSSVAVIEGGEIERSAAQDVYDVIRATPNASLEEHDYGFGGMTLRGIGSYGASGAGAFAAYSTTSAVVFDGVGLPRSALSYADLSAFDLASVEILRGPQSTSLGRNAMAGGVVINSIAPEPLPGFFPQLRGRVSGGDANSRHYALAGEATLLPDTLALRLVHDRRNDDGDNFNATRGEDDWARRESESTRLRAKWQPAGAGGRYSALFGVYDMQRYSGSNYVLLGEEESRVATSNAPYDYDNDAQMLSLDQGFRLSDRWQMHAVSAWIRSQTISRFDTDYGPEDDAATFQEEDARAFSQELRLQYQGERIKGSVGAYYYDSRDGDVSSGYININAALDQAGICGLEILCSLPLGNVLFESAQPAEVEDIAVFGELDWAATERLTLTAGVRADREENSRVISASTAGDSPTADLAVSLLTSAGAVPGNTRQEVSREFSEVLPKVAARYELFDGWFLGAAYTEGYRPGGSGFNQVSGRVFEFDSERTKNVELSFKGIYDPWKLQFALNLFRTRWEDMQLQGGEGTDTFIENAGRATIQGGELEFRWQAMQKLQLVGGYGVTRGEFDQYISTEGEDFAGNKLPKAPEYSGLLALEWRPWSSLLIRPDVQWTGSTPANADNQSQHELFSYRLVNMTVRWQVGPATLFMAGTNLTDEHYRRDANDFSLFVDDVVSLGQRRRVMGGLEFEF